MKNFEITISAIGICLMLIYSGCSDDDPSDPQSVAQQIGEALQGSWQVTDRDPGNPDDAYDNMQLTFGAYDVESNEASLSATSIVEELGINFGSGYSLDNPQSVTSFVLIPSGDINRINCAGDPVAGTLHITFVSENTAAGGRTQGIGEYGLTLTKQ